jgi:hypothetical protein
MLKTPTTRAADAAAGERRLADEHERVERIAVVAQRALDEAVVRRIAHRREEPPVEDDLPGGGVDLVLVARAHRHLDEDGRLHSARVYEAVPPRRPNEETPTRPCPRRRCELSWRR